MSWCDESPVPTVFRRAEEGADRFDDRRLRAQIARGNIVRISRGSYVAAPEWTQLTPIQRHAQRVWEAAARMSPGRVFSHRAAAALWGIDLSGSWPEQVDVSGQGLGGSSGAVRRHDRDESRLQITPWGEHFVTTPAQTAVDLAAVLRFGDAVVAADQAIWSGRPGGALATLVQLEEAAEEYRGRSHRRVHAVAEFARPGAASVRESQSRVLIAHLGFPEPELQHRFELPSGRVAYTDFWWRDYAQVGEFDGVGKYLDPRLLKGRTPAEALIEEKDRADELRRQVRVISRWRSPALASPRRLFDILSGDGLPAARPRPGR